MSIEPIVTLYVGEIARPGDDIVLYAGAAMSAGAFAAMLAAPTIGRLADRHGHWRVVALCFAARYPGLSDRIVVVSAADRAQILSTAWRSVQRQIVREAIAAVPGVHSIVVEPESGGPGLRYLVKADQRPEVAQELAAALVGRGLALSELTTVRPDLERIFLQLTQRPSEAAA